MPKNDWNSPAFKEEERASGFGLLHDEIHDAFHLIIKKLKYTYNRTALWSSASWGKEKEERSNALWACCMIFFFQKIYIVGY